MHVLTTFFDRRDPDSRKAKPHPMTVEAERDHYCSILQLSNMIILKRKLKWETRQKKENVTWNNGWISSDPVTPHVSK